MLEEIQYRGNERISQLCIDAVVELIHAGHSINKVMLLSSGNRHAFLLNVSYLEMTMAIKSGFMSGYNGEGAKALAYTLNLLYKYCDDIDEYLISDKLMNRLNAGQLKERDLENIISIEPVRPQIWHDYIYYQKQETKDVYRHFPKEFPMSIIEPRLHDLALRFNENANDALRDGYCLIENIIKEKTGMHNLFGVNLFQSAFANHRGIKSLFVGVFQQYRNPRAHEILEQTREDNLREFLMLNQLFILEASVHLSDEQDNL